MTTRQRWYPSQQDFSDPQKTERVLREVLDRLYTLAERHEAVAAVTEKNTGDVSALKLNSTIPSTNITSVDVIDQGDPVAPDPCATFTVSATNGVFSLDWTDPANNITTLDNYALQYATDNAFTTGVHGPVLLGKINSLKITEPSVTYYFRISAHNQSNDVKTNTNAGLNALISGGWGEWKNYGAPTAVASGGMTITAGTIQTGTSNPRVIIDSSGIRAYDAGGNKTFDVTSAGTVMAALIRSIVSADYNIQLNATECALYHTTGQVQLYNSNGSLILQDTGNVLIAVDLTVNGDLDAASLTLDTALAIAEGGTGATTALGARTALDVYDTGTVDGLIGGFATAAAIAGTTLTLAKITPGGSDGSLTFNNEGIITGYVAPT